MTAATLWFTGLHCSGKTTISKELAQYLQEQKIPFTLLDGDEVRKTLSADLGYSIEDRNEHMKRVAQASQKQNEEDKLCIACVASPTEHSRQQAREIIANMVLVHVKCSVETAEKRDVKGHYKKARANQPGFEHFVGIHIPFEEPTNADIVLDTENNDLQTCLNQLIATLKEKNII